MADISSTMSFQETTIVRQITGTQFVKRVFAILVSTALCNCSSASGVQLNVPLVQQSEGRLCGPAAIEMVFRFWGEEGYDQYDIARQIATEFSSEDRFKNNAYAHSGHPDDYPGTPVYILRKYLETKGTSDKYSLKELPSQVDVLEQKYQKAFAWIKNHLDQGVPVIIHQYWASTSSTGHYRVVTGYDDHKKLVYLNDAKVGKIEQTYDEFKKKGAFAGKWMPYYSIAFNSDRR